jgi:hypothetical protein
MIRDQGVAMLLRGNGETRAHFHTGTRGTTQQRDINVTAEAAASTGQDSHPSWTDTCSLPALRVRLGWGNML